VVFIGTGTGRGCRGARARAGVRLAVVRNGRFWFGLPPCRLRGVRFIWRHPVSRRYQAAALSVISHRDETASAF